ncbi:MAG: hypothetical protein AAF235_03925, partial [Planctomycetota bacterium]
MPGSKHDSESGLQSGSSDTAHTGLYAPPPAETPHVGLERYRPTGSAEDAAGAFYETMKLRRTVRMFSPEPVSRE